VALTSGYTIRRGERAIVRAGRVETGMGGGVSWGNGTNGMNQTPTTVTRLLDELQNGEGGALEELFGLLYEELHGLARRHRQRWHGDYTLDTTALVHEAFLKLAGQPRVQASDRAHFSAVAARAMRHILCNYARDRRTQKRGGGVVRVTLDEGNSPAVAGRSSAGDSEELVALDDALRRLEALDPRRSKVVECRFFGGLTVEETAVAVGASERTVKRDWAVAQAWLHRELTSAVDPGP
jgi:RNA polymerase sigma factor (TIGR02999 family)